MGIEGYTAGQWFAYSASAIFLVLMLAVTVLAAINNKDDGGDAY